jgi:hypothetical protein
MLNLGQFTLIGEDAFDELIDVKPVSTSNISYNYCEDCEIPMILSANEYLCSKCGQTKEFHSPQSNDVASGCIRVTTGANRGKYYNINSDYTKLQKKFIDDQLACRARAYTGKPIPVHILREVVIKYNTIQKQVVEPVVDANGNILGNRKFVKRGNIKDEVLAALIYFEHINNGLIRKKREIATFMDLPTGGFARGEGIVRRLHANKHIQIPDDDDEPIMGYIDRYLESLDIDNENYYGFIHDVVVESEDRNIGMNSHIASKIVGAIWVVIVQCKLTITPLELEKATDNTKKNTFSKFAAIIMNHINIFKAIFEKYNIPL